MRRLVFGLGGLQVAVTTGLLAAAANHAGLGHSEAIILGACLSLSSTAIVLELLSNQERLTSNVGRATFSVLLAQDLAVIPLLIFISLLAAGPEGSVLQSLVRAFLQAVVALTVIILFGRLLMRPLFRLVASTRSRELFIAAVLFVIIASGVIASEASLSMALGAFVAGLLLAETEYRKAIEAAIAPFKGLLLGIFFFTVGMDIDVRELLYAPALLLAAVVGLIAVKALLAIGFGKLFRLSWPSAVEMGLLLGPGGEFAFVGIGMAAALGLIDGRLASAALAVTSVTMALTPGLSFVGRRIGTRLRASAPVATELAVRPSAEEKHAIVVGYGRVGKVVCALLKEHGIAFIAADSDTSTVTRDRRDGHEVYYGDASDDKFLEICGLDKASGVIITIHNHDLIDDVVDPCARHAPRHHHRVARPRRRSRAPSLCARRHRRGAGNRRGEPAAFRSGAGRARHSHGSGDCVDPRKARRDPPRLAGSRARGRPGADSCREAEAQAAAARRAVIA